MDDLRKKIDEGENWYQKLIEKIPGFAGYFEREKRRTADKLLRDYLANRLRESKDALMKKANELFKAHDFDTLNELNDLVKHFQMVIDKIQYAPHGYSGFFGAIKVDTPELDNLYNIDATLVSLIEETEDIMKDASKTAKEQVKLIEEELKKFEEKITERQNILSGIS
ncbi:MAG: hypothetical protein J7L03_07290 [Caldisericaceae bacterium]|nr:hypothetical protein [Caldisericaceae bacterium]